MSFSPRNVSELLVAMTTGGGVGSWSNHFVTDLQAQTGEPLYKAVFMDVETVGGKKVSGKIVPGNVTSIVSNTMSAGVAKSAAVTCVAGAVGDVASVTIDVHDGIGSPLNDRFINAYFEVSTPTDADTIAAGLATALTNAIAVSGDDFTVSVASAVITITEGSVKHRPGWNDGFFPEWDIQAKLKARYDGAVTGFGVVYSGGTKDDLTQAKNIEWFNSGYSKDPYRETGYPASFEADSNIVAAGVPADALCTIIQYYDNRDATNVERQHKQLIILGPGGPQLVTLINTKKS